MRRAVRWLLWLVAALAVLAGAGLGYVIVVYPIAEEPRALKVERTPERIARGKYLAENVAVCTDCHSERDFTRYSGPVKPGTEGKGGQNFGHEFGLPGEIVARNITPYKLASWSDGEIVRAITSGVTPDGRALFPIMGYQSYAQMCEEDLLSLVSYLRSMAPIENDPPATQIDFPVNLIIRTLPKPAQLVKKCPDRNDSLALGKYLATIANCGDCHSPRNDSGPIAGKEFSGSEFKLPGGVTLRSKNLTPDMESGIGSWSKEVFINRFRPYRNAAELAHVAPGEPQTIMPWSQYAQMSDEDLGAIYDYLRTQKPVRTQVSQPVAQR